MAAANNPLVMNFEGATTHSLWKEDYTENGIKMSLVANHYDIVLDSGSGDTYVHVDTHPRETASIKFELVDGGLFRLDSLAVFLVQHTWTSPAPAPPEFTGFADYDFTFSDGSILVPEHANQWVVLDDFFSELPLLTYFIYSIRLPIPDGYVSWQFNSRLDNITLTPVPEPSAFVMVGLGCTAMLCRRRSDA